MSKVRGTPSDSSLSTTASANFEDPLALGKQLVELIGRLIDEADPKTEKICVEFGLTAFFNDPKKVPVRHLGPGLSPIKSATKSTKTIKTSKTTKTSKNTKTFKTIRQPTKSVSSASPRSMRSTSPGSLSSRSAAKLVECKMSSDTHNMATDGTEELIKTKSDGGGYRDGYFIDVKMDGDDQSPRDSKKAESPVVDAGKCRFLDVKMDSDEGQVDPDSNDESSIESKKPSQRSSKKRSSRRSSKSRSGKSSKKRFSKKERSKKEVKPRSRAKRHQSPDGEDNCANYY